MIVLSACSAPLLVVCPLGHNPSIVFLVRDRRSTIISQFVDRMIRAAKLDEHVYEEVKANKSAMSRCDYSAE
jgi:hypothetical protein